jgi:hypothetical protein
MKALTMAQPVVVPDKPLLASFIFTVPPQGDAMVGHTDSQALIRLKVEIIKRLETPVLLSVYPHRVGKRSCLAVLLTDARENVLNILITVTGNTLWPDDRDYQEGALACLRAGCNGYVMGAQGNRSRCRGKPLGVTHPPCLPGSVVGCRRTGRPRVRAARSPQVSLCDAHFKDALYFVSIVRMRQTPPPQGVCFY